ncbi:MAG: T9SS type A sorting domain-containing protein [Ferruginibacter sp.]
MKQKYQPRFKNTLIVITTLFLLLNPELKAQQCWKVLSTKYGRTLALDTSNKLWGWGSKTLLNVPPGTNVNPSLPYPIGNDSNWKTVSTGADVSVALKNDGTLWAWGYYGYNRYSYVPVQISPDHDWQSISAGWFFSAAIKADGTLWTFGANNRFGPFGDGTQNNRDTIAQVGTDKDWKQVAAANTCGLAIKTNGTLWAWGKNAYGQLGDGTFIDKYAPIQIGTGTDWKYISSNDMHCLALKTDGSLWGWGYNYHGQVGDGSTTMRNTPVRIGVDTDWTNIETGSSHSLAIKTNGTLWAWGENLNGQLGNGSNGYEHYYTPVQSGNDNHWKTVLAGYFHSYGQKNDGSFWTWGWHNEGRLGDGIYNSDISQDLPEKLICPAEIALPITLLSFTAKKQTTAVLLNWETETEINFSNFVLEHSSNGIDFKKIAVIQASTNPSLVKKYSYKHTVPNNGFNYYRLKETDKDGSFKYSKSAVVYISGKESAIFPNPASSTITIEHVEGLTAIDILAVTGNRVQQLKPLPGNQYNISMLPRGIYFVKLQYKSSYEVRRFTKQ